MKRKVLTLCLLLCFLSACGDGSTVEEEVFEEDMTLEEIEPETPLIYHPLTGEVVEEDVSEGRPYAIMLNNIKDALPQLGQSQADIIYECLAEGGITRMLAVYQDVSEVEMIGSVRSSRPYYLELALGHDALYLHAGGSEDAYTYISSWGVDAFDCVRGPYMSSTVGGNIFWRDSWRQSNLGYEHSVVTTGEAILTYIPESTRMEHEDDFTYEQTFYSETESIGGETALEITVPFSSYKTGVFIYDETSETYFVEEYGSAYVDGNTDEQVAITNVLVLNAVVTYTGDSLGHVDIDFDAGGTGYFATAGEILPITWSKDGIYEELQYFYEDGSPVVLNPGTSYVNVIPNTNSTTWVGDAVEEAE